MNDQLLSRGMLAVLVAQFVSALADNALLFAAIALLKAGAAPDWQIPVLQQFFVLAYIVLAPFAGPFADALPKGRVLLIANAMKLLGAGALLAGLHPLLAYAMVGLGAAAYSPAKYGILGELVSQDKLVKANSMMEGSTILAILMGAILGGILADRSVTLALVAVVVAYLLAALANLLIPSTKPSTSVMAFRPLPLLKEFWHAVRTLFADADARFSLVGTGVFWGVGATLRFLLVAWVPLALGINDLSTPANLSGAVAIGVALGAVLAAKYVSLSQVNRVLPVGILLGVLVMGLAVVTNLYVAAILLVLIGAAGGFYVVPLNALLQDRGHASVGTGQAIAAQNLVENTLMLTMIGLYTGLTSLQVTATESALAFGLLITVSLGGLAALRMKQSFNRQRLVQQIS